LNCEKKNSLLSKFEIIEFYFPYSECLKIKGCVLESLNERISFLPVKGKNFLKKISFEDDGEKNSNEE